MNVNNFNHSASTSKTQVTSKYFSNEAVLDESLTEFQEKRKIVGPKNPPKQAPKRKCQKRIKGQKDIRTLIKKNNDLVEYSKSFNNICKKSGIDIDSEQLQLAIALSKSLHDSKQCPNDTDVAKTLTSREKSNKIRTTLQEYGFQVPELKATNLNKIKHKRYNLLTTSDEEKQQIISAKYMKIISSNRKNVIIETNLQKGSIFYKSTSMLFEEMKNNDVFYVNGLIEKSLNTIFFLRDWSDIPGRCQSPVFEGPYISFNDVMCSQDELDIFLTCSIAITQNICHLKLRNYSLQTGRLSYNTSAGSVEQEMSSKILSNETLSLSMSEKINNLDEDIEILKNDNDENYIVNETLSQPLSMVTEYIDSETDLHHKTVANCVSKSFNETTVSPYRCKSPDLFDEEVSTILNMPPELSKSIIKYDTIDLTQCVPSNIKPDISNVSRRLSNNVMELTECIGRGLNSEDKIDLTQELNDDDTIVYVEENVNFRKTMNSSEMIQLDQVIILDEINTVSILPDSVADVIKENIQTVDSKNLTESSDTCDSLPDIKVGGEDKKATTENINDTLYAKVVTEVPTLTSRDSESNNIINKLNRNNISSFFKDTTSTNENIDLTLSKESNYCTVSSDLSKICNPGKIDNLSIDYDDMFDQIIKNTTNASKSTNNSTEYVYQNRNSSFLNSEELASESETCRLSDQESKYSVNICIDNSQNNFKELPSIDMNWEMDSVECKILTPIKEKNFEIIKTPSNNEYIIKTVDVTPMQNFEAMSSPERNKELEKYGLKPFKRKRAIQLLTYIYNQTHPVVESCEAESTTKKPKLNSPQKIIPGNLTQSPRKSQKSPRKTNFSDKKPPAICQDMYDKDNIFIQTDDTPTIKNIACEPEDWVFQKREKAKVHSCSVPLHIAFHNYVSCRRLLREAILCYEPINIDTVHKDLVAAGYRYNPKDLLKFMDKKCITVKTADNNARNKR